MLEKYVIPGPNLIGYINPNRTFSGELPDK
jgi:hypothetical protein